MQKPSDADTTGKRVLSFIERIERLDEEIKASRGDRSEVLKEAKFQGFDTKTILRIVKERKKTAQEREEEEALLDLYKAAIGMLDGTPLGYAAIHRLQKKKPAEQVDDEIVEEAEEVEPLVTEESIQEARTLGMSDASDGKPVTSNPFPAHDARRAAYDEGWCQAAGTDGMDIPDAWKPAPKGKKKPDGEEGAE